MDTVKGLSIHEAKLQIGKRCSSFSSYLPSLSCFLFQDWKRKGGTERNMKCVCGRSAKLEHWRVIKADADASFSEDGSIWQSSSSIKMSLTSLIHLEVDRHNMASSALHLLTPSVYLPWRSGSNGPHAPGLLKFCLHSSCHFAVYKKPTPLVHHIFHFLKNSKFFNRVVQFSTIII